MNNEVISKEELLEFFRPHLARLLAHDVVMWARRYVPSRLRELRDLVALFERRYDVETASHLGARLKLIYKRASQLNVLYRRFQRLPAGWKAKNELIFESLPGSEIIDIEKPGVK